MGERKKTRQILVGKVKMGGGAPVTIQSMLNTPAGHPQSAVGAADRAPQECGQRADCGGYPL